MFISCFCKSMRNNGGEIEASSQIDKIANNCNKTKAYQEFNLTPVNIFSVLPMHDTDTLLFIPLLLMSHRKQHQRTQTSPTDFHHFIVLISFNWSQKLVSAYEVRWDCWCWPFLKFRASQVDELFMAVDGTSPLLFTNEWRAVMWHETWPWLSTLH